MHVYRGWSFYFFRIWGFGVVPWGSQRVGEKQFWEGSRYFWTTAN